MYKISVLSKLLPRYGELLLTTGAIVRINPDIASNDNAILKIKNFLLVEAWNVRQAQNLSKSREFQKIMYECGKFIKYVSIDGKNIDNDSITDIYLLKLFERALWPIIVDRYVDQVKYVNAKDIIKIGISIQKKSYSIIYEDGGVNVFFNELKQFLLENYIVISRAQIQENGDLVIEILIPCPEV